MVTLPTAAGAVNSPLEEMDPPLAVHVTAELELPLTVAVHCDVEPGTIAAGAQLTCTLDEGDPIGLELPPHAETMQAISPSNSAAAPLTTIRPPGRPC
jgi:hypothetical protein